MTEKKKILTTDAPQTKREIEEPKISFPPGPVLQTADLGKDGKVLLDDRTYVLRFAEDVDYSQFRAILEAKCKAKPTGRRILPSGLGISASKVLFLCTKCRASFWLDDTADNMDCPSCNLAHYKEGGKLRRASKAEEKAWFKKETESEARWKADKPRREAELREFNRRIRADMGTGERR